MAATKHYVDINNLDLFKELQDADHAALLAAAQALDLKVARTNATTGALELFKDAEPAAGATPDYTYLPVAANISIADVGGKLDATNVEDALAELADRSAGGVASKTVYLQDESAGQTDYAKVYKLYQGSDSSDMTQNKLVGTINIAKDKVVQDGHLVTVTDGVDSDGDTVPAGTVNGKYVKLILQNVDTPIYINVQDLIDVYTGGTTAEATVAISATNEITVTINKIAATKVIYQAADAEQGTPEINVKTKIDNVEAKVDAIDVAGDIATAIGALDAEVSIPDATNTNPLNITVTEADGVLTGVTGSIDPNTFDAYGDAAQALADAIGTSSDASSADTINGAKAYAAEYTDAIAEADIRALFTSSAGE